MLGIIHQPYVLPATEFLCVMIYGEQDVYYSHIQHAYKLFRVDCVVPHGSNALNCDEKLVQEQAHQQNALPYLPRNCFPVLQGRTLLYITEKRVSTDVSCLNDFEV